MRLELVRNEPLKSLWVYLNINDPVVAWSCYCGILFPASFVGKYIAPNAMPLGLRAYSMFKFAAQNNKREILSSEVMLEDVRRRFYPEKNSRLSGMFAFESYEDAEEGKRWGIGHFIEEFLVELQVDPASVFTVVDSNWFTKHANIGISEEMAHAYWRGEPEPEGNPLWEVIFDAPACICGTELRMRCLELFKKNMPQAVQLLDLSRVATELGYTLGVTVPFMVTEDDKTYIKFYGDMNDAHDSNFLSALKNYNGPRLQFKDVSLVMPDFRDGVVELCSGPVLTVLSREDGKRCIILHQR